MFCTCSTAKLSYDSPGMKKNRTRHQICWENVMLKMGSHGWPRKWKSFLVLQECAVVAGFAVLVSPLKIIFSVLSTVSRRSSSCRTISYYVLKEVLHGIATRSSYSRREIRSPHKSTSKHGCSQRFMLPAPHSYSITSTGTKTPSNDG